MRFALVQIARRTTCATALLLALLADRPSVLAQSIAGPTHVAAVVTGNPASPAFVRTQIDAAIERAYAPIVPAGSKVMTSAVLPSPQALSRGFLTSFSVQVQIDVPGGAPLVTTTTVDVTNVDIAGFAPVTLAFRDDPERIVADGVLSRTIIDSQQPTRVYYYHENTGVARRFLALLSVTDSVTTHAQVVSAAAGPNVDVMSVGHAATQMFLARQPRDEGSVITIAGGRPYVQRDGTVGVGEVVAGAVDVRVLDGGPVTLTVMAIAPDLDPRAVFYAPKLANDGHARHGNFALTGFAQRVIAYTVGGPDAAYVYGSRSRTPAGLDPADAGHDFGDYGVLQRISFDLANPTELPVRLYLYEKPLGGVVRSSFLVDGTLIEVGCARIAMRYEVSTYDLAPRSTATLDVLTMTDGGSNYPLEIGVTATPPLPATPPMFASDGCFPKPDRAAAR